MAALGGKRVGMVARPNNPARKGVSEGDAFVKARELQRGLYVAAKRQPDRRFHALYDRIWRSDVLLEAWERVRSNNCISYSAPFVIPEVVHVARENHR